jgi:branched-chain amino acid transport system substrate-binding protein
VVGFREGYDSQTATPESLAEVAGQIKSTEADLFYYGSSLGFSLIQAVRSVDPDLPIMVPDGIVQSELISTSGVALEGVWGTTVVVPVDQLPAAELFSANYEAAYGQLPGLFAATGYEAMKVIIQAIGRTRAVTRQNVLTEIRDQGEFSGVMGRWHFDEAGDISHIALSGVQIQDNQWKFVQMLE